MMLVLFGIDFPHDMVTLAGGFGFVKRAPYSC